MQPPLERQMKLSFYVADTIGGNTFPIPFISDWINGEYIDIIDGSVKQNETYHRTDFIEINPYLGPIEFTNIDVSQYYDVKYNAWYDENKVFIGSFSIWANHTIAIQPPLNAKYMRLSFNKTTKNTIRASYYSPFSSLIGLLKNPLIRENFDSSHFRTGYYKENAIINYTDTTRITTNSPIKVNKGDTVQIHIDNYNEFNYSFRRFSNLPGTGEQTMIDGSIMWNSFSGPDIGIFIVNDGYFVLNLRRPDNSELLPSDCTVVVSAPPQAVNSEIVDYTPDHLRWDGSDYFRAKFSLHMTYTGSGTYEIHYSRNAIISPLHFSFDICVIASDGYKFALQFFDGYETGESHALYSTGWTRRFVIPKNSYFGMIVGNSDDTTTDNTTQNNLTFEGYVTANDIYNRLASKQNKLHIGENYAVGSDMTKRAVNIERIGKLQYGQSFCKYNGKYYSTNGSNIAEQDASFNVLRDVSLNLGHGNSLQLGSNGIAYAWGWDDNKIRAVDLNTLSITQTIQLPTSGYTTGVIDPVRELVYIFQRDSYPSTEEAYNFIVFNLGTSSVINRKKTISFGALQACDLYNDKIIALNGLGNADCPNGYRTYSVDGNVLSEYKLGEFSNQEPEGIFVDRDTLDVFISFVDNQIYRLS